MIAVPRGRRRDEAAAGSRPVEVAESGCGCGGEVVIGEEANARRHRRQTLIRSAVPRVRDLSLIARGANVSGLAVFVSGALVIACGVQGGTL